MCVIIIRKMFKLWLAWKGSWLSLSVFLALRMCISKKTPQTNAKLHTNHHTHGAAASTSSIVCWTIEKASIALIQLKSSAHFQTHQIDWTKKNNHWKIMKIRKLYFSLIILRSRTLTLENGTNEKSSSSNNNIQPLLQNAKLKTRLFDAFAQLFQAKRCFELYIRCFIFSIHTRVCRDQFWEKSANPNIHMSNELTNERKKTTTKMRERANKNPKQSW